MGQLVHTLRPRVEIAAPMATAIGIGLRPSLDSQTPVTQEPSLYFYLGVAYVSRKACRHQDVDHYSPLAGNTVALHLALHR